MPTKTLHKLRNVNLVRNEAFCDYCEAKVRIRRRGKTYKTICCAGPLIPLKDKKIIYHNLSDVDEKTRIAICDQCGIVRYRLRDGKPRCVNNSLASSQHGLTEGERRDLIKRIAQCQICEVKLEYFNSVNRYGECQRANLNVDHCHRTGKIRGVLCTNCNTALGHFRDSISLLESAIAYLKERA